MCGSVLFKGYRGFHPRIQEQERRIHHPAPFTALIRTTQPKVSCPYMPPWRRQGQLWLRKFFRWDMTQCRWARSSRHFGRSVFLHSQGQAIHVIECRSHHVSIWKADWLTLSVARMTQTTSTKLWVLNAKAGSTHSCYCPLKDKRVKFTKFLSAKCNACVFIQLPWWSELTFFLKK
jgi:hypothetical protein